MVTTKFVWSEFNTVIQEELMHINFVDFGEGLVTAFSRYKTTCKIYTFPLGILKASFFLAGNTCLLVPSHYLMIIKDVVYYFLCLTLITLIQWHNIFRIL